jgi:hypothetical protein
MLTLTAWDLGQIALLLAACWGCYRAGIEKGIGKTLDWMESEGIIEIKDEEQ